MEWFPIKRRRHSSPLAALGPPLLGGHYQVGERLSRGATSEVFRGIDMRSGTPVAIKFIALPMDLPPAAREDLLLRLAREAKLYRHLQHPGIVALHANGLLPNQAWMVMEHIQGADLGRYLRPERRLPDPLALRIGVRVGAALAHAHAHGVVHRDLKPANVLVDLTRGMVKLADFGVARTADSSATRTGLTVGTPAYMAPELLAGAPATAASDTYALGVMLYELLCGRRPHEADSLGGLLQAMAQAPHTPLARQRPDLPATIAARVEQLLDRAPDARPTDLTRWGREVHALSGLMARVQMPRTTLRL